MLGIIHELLLVLMVITALAVIEERDLVVAVVKYALLSLIFVLVLFQLKAPDVALSAIVVGAVIIGIFLFTIEEVEKSGGTKR
ncbi:hydrogenase subunit MbhD domain-containing protein [Thermococcus barophilus]|uniref:Multisubunit sodium/hydrogen antiporter n=2 Tax=Thermococcus barophilus TaxID=55802 RepID=F0LHK0_THEBM|nr:hydrogenase subunit MbhD domain-containing protein [Thermococcus barophilus]ADT84327.1 multisubunit sodium/hydrogen antiporter [Thermococcus barophilus MP]